MPDFVSLLIAACIVGFIIRETLDDLIAKENAHRDESDHDERPEG